MNHNDLPTQPGDAAGSTTATPDRRAKAQQPNRDKEIEQLAAELKTLRSTVAHTGRQLMRIRRYTEVLGPDGEIKNAQQLYELLARDARQIGQDLLKQLPTTRPPEASVNTPMTGEELYELGRLLGKLRADNERPDGTAYLDKEITTIRDLVTVLLEDRTDLHQSGRHAESESPSRCCAGREGALADLRARATRAVRALHSLPGAYTVGPGNEMRVIDLVYGEICTVADELKQGINK